MKQYENAAIVLFARQPLYGQVKTRLEPVLGRAGALRMHEALIRHMVAQFAGSALAELQLCVDGDPDHALFRDCAGPLPRFSQVEGHLGQRMQAAARRVLAEREMVVLVGADCASVDPDYVAEALAALARGTDVVIGPAEDGGYVLLGLRRSDLRLFEALPWGSAQVLERTRQCLRVDGVDWLDLAPRWDLDRPEDLPRLRELPGWSGPQPESEQAFPL